MNIFEASIKSGKITNDVELKRLFWRLAKKLHPDVSHVEKNERKFITLKQDYDDALNLLAEHARVPAVDPGPPDFHLCTDLFCELVASNFPVDISVRGKNRKYVERIVLLNEALGRFGPGYDNLFLKVEEELYRIRGKTVVSNHVFNLVKLFLYNISDYLATDNYFAKIYIRNSRDTVTDCLGKNEARNTLAFINWLLSDVK